MKDVVEQTTIETSRIVSNRGRVVLLIAVIVLLALLGFTYFQYGVLKIRVAFASEQTEIFSEMRTKALQSSVSEAAGFLQYVVGYYPSGSKQITGSRLDAIVERDRALAIRDIIVYLRSKTHEDLGTNAQPWIEKYAKD